MKCRFQGYIILTMKKNTAAVDWPDPIQSHLKLPIERMRFNVRLSRRCDQAINLLIFGLTANPIHFFLSANLISGRLYTGPIDFMVLFNTLKVDVIEEKKISYTSRHWLVKISLHEDTVRNQLKQQLNDLRCHKLNWM